MQSDFHYSKDEFVIYFFVIKHAVKIGMAFE